MPRRSPTPCATPGCATLTPDTRCPAHTRQARRTQARQRRAAGDPSMDAYSTSEWKRTRRRQLARHPLCVECGAPATEVDHVIPRRVLLARGVHDPDHTRWLQSLCEPCHARKTATHDGGFGRDMSDIDAR